MIPKLDSGEVPILQGNSGILTVTRIIQLSISMKTVNLRFLYRLLLWL